MNVLSLFSGIGGIDLGLERAGMRVVAQCEADPFCRAVLRKHWPDVPCFDDVRTLSGSNVRDVDLIAGGFPCQDVSAAGKGAGIGGARSGLWREMARLVGECRPAWVLVENVPALRTRGADRVLADLEALGYDAWPLVVGAWAVGAPHRRDRVWIVANAIGRRDGEERPVSVRPGGPLEAAPNASRAGSSVADPDSADVREQSRRLGGTDRPGTTFARRSGEALADAAVPGLEGAGLPGRLAERGESSDPDRDPSRRPPVPRRECGQWLVEPDVGRVAHGVPSRVDRLRSLGNAVVPAVVEAIGRAIMKEASL